MQNDRYRGRYFATLEKLDTLEDLAADMAQVLGQIITRPNIELTPHQDNEIRDLISRYENRD